MHVVALLLTMLIWAGSFIFIKIGLQEIKPYNLAFYRFTLASPVLLLAVYLKKKLEPVKLEDLLHIIILAITGVTLLYAVQFVALTYTTATNSSILMNTSVVFIAVMSFFLGEKFTKLKTLGLCSSFLGVMLVVSKGEFEFFSSKTFIGDMLIIFDGFLWAVYTILGKNLLEKYSPEVLTAYAFAIGSILLFPFALYEGITNPLSLSMTAWISLLYLSLLCSVFAYLIWYSALAVMEATKVAAFVYIIPFFTAIMAFSVLGEEIGIFTALGGILTITGVYLVERH
ncbi:MAG: DMT family transporter [Archaeoglobi archaeon]|nr:DMT family transporter [Candidatus Mnemosynella bozhongmuii]